MAWWGRLWNLCYLGRAPWDIGGPRPELVRLVESGKLGPCRAIDLGCGIGENVVYLTRQGFQVTGVDISPRAIAKARRKAQAAGVSPTLLVADVTNLTGVEGPFELAVDNGCLHSLLVSAARHKYVGTVLRLTYPGSRYFLRCFVKDPRKRFSSLVFGRMEPDEAEQRFGGEFHIQGLEPLPPGLSVDAVYLMVRKGAGG
jgi:SAM-dependent methyltransferase